MYIYIYCTQYIYIYIYIYTYEQSKKKGPKSGTPGNNTFRHEKNLARTHRDCQNKLEQTNGRKWKSI